MAIGFYAFRVVAWCVSRLPFWVIHLKSDALYFILYHLIGYRKKVVFENLANAFPEMPEDERKRTARKFYHNLCDIILEDIKIEGMTREEMMHHVTFSNLEILDKLNDDGRSSIMAMGHCGNWEWVGHALALNAKQNAYVAVKPLSDKRFNAYMERLRGHFVKDHTFPFKMTLRYLLKLKGEPYVVALAGDQTPTRQESTFWTTFLNQETAFFEGLGKLAVSLDLAVFYIDIRRVKRGYYHGTINLISSDGSDSRSEDIILEYVNRLERNIIEAPDNWLWSHRRWKHRRSDEPLYPRHAHRDIV